MEYFSMKSKYWRLQLLARYNVLKADHPVRRMNPIDCFVVVRWSKADEIHALYLIFYYPSGALNKILFSGFLLCNHLFLGLKRLFMNVHDFEIRINSIIRFQTHIMYYNYNDFYNPRPLEHNRLHCLPLNFFRTPVFCVTTSPFRNLCWYVVPEGSETELTELGRDDGSWLFGSAIELWIPFSSEFPSTWSSSFSLAVSVSPSSWLQMDIFLF